MKNSTVEKIVEDMNEEFGNMLVADVTAKGNIQISIRTRRYMDMYEVEELLNGALEYITMKHDVDFSIINHYKNALIVEVFEY